MSEANILEMRWIDKSFGAVAVLKRASFALRRGEVHALMGGNGAGKSTLMKILTGVYSKDSGTITIDGRAVDISSPSDAEKLGIAMIFQELSLVPTLTVAQNIYLAREPRKNFGSCIDDAELLRRARAILEDLGEHIDPATPVEQLSVGMSQMVEIAKALSKNARILIMDEPTSSISEDETQRLFKLVNKLKQSGISIIYISHRMSEIFTICDRVTVMRDGESVLTDDCANLGMAPLIAAMLGKSDGAALQWHRRTHDLGRNPVLQVSGITRHGKFEDVSFSVYPGEVVGLAGLMGSGRSEIAEAIFGLDRLDAGRIDMGGVQVRNNRAAIDAGVALIPENRRIQGLVLDHSVQDNVMLPNLERFTKGLFVKTAAGAKAATDFIARLKIKGGSPETQTCLLSGGNQQKVVLAKWLSRAPRLLILDEPTMGIDIGAKAEIVELVRKLAAQGTAVIVISSEFEELLALSDRLLIIRNGRLVDDLDRSECDNEEVLHHAVQS